MPGDILQAIIRYCQYQERCHAEVRNKLYEWGCKTTEVETIIAELIQRDVLNEERFARAIARGKFRMKKWGRQKIVQQLKFYKISNYCIKKALTEIDMDEYDRTLTSLAEKKWHEFVTEKSIAKRKYKVYRFLIQKGFETNEVNAIIQKMITG
jgi:regulatory protein